MQQSSGIVSSRIRKRTEWLTGSIDAGRRGKFLAVGGQDDGEGAAFAHFGFDFDSAFVMLDDFLADGKTEAGAFGFAFSGGALGGEEGLENARDELVGNSWATVDDLKEDFGMGGVAETFDGQ